MQGRGVQVVQIEENQPYKLDEVELRKILLRDDIKDLPVVIISVAGAHRGGKSFLLNFFLRYLMASRSSQDDGSWLGDDHTPLEGFSWRGGSKRNTTGIVMWSEPVISTRTGEKVAVILMDTQGTFDMSSTVRDCSTIFALSTLLSSVQIYNLSTNIREDTLQHLQLFTEYGKLIKDQSVKAFQVLEFLVRDWPNHEEYPYGASGGTLYLEEILKTNSRQPKELRELREHIRASFTTVSCFLLPHPGLKVTKSDFDGKNSAFEPEFKIYIKDLAAHIFGPARLKPKVISGQPVKASDIFTYFKAYMKIFNSDQLPTPTSIMTATAEAGLLSAFEAARRLYEAGMDAECGAAQPSVPAHDVRELHEKHAGTALAAFNSRKKMGAEDNVKKYLDKLKEELKNRLPQYGELNKGKTQKAIMEAIEAYENTTGQIRSELLCVHPLDLEHVHQEALQAAVALFIKNRRTFSNKEDKEKTAFIKGFEKQYTQLKLTNEQNNKTAVNELRLEYWQTMAMKCSGEAPLSESEFQTVHKQALEQALESFANKRNRPNSYDDDEHKANLEEMIQHCFDQVRTINKSKNKAALQSGIRAYDEYMATAWNAKEVCLHPDDLNNEHTAGERLSLIAFRPNTVSSGKVSFDTTDEDEKIMSEVLHSRFKEIVEINNSANETAVQAALNAYISAMDYNCGMTVWWFVGLGIPYLVNKSNRDGYHKESKEKAQEIFYKRRRDRANTSADSFFDKLESKIKEARKKY